MISIKKYLEQADPVAPLAAPSAAEDIYCGRKEAYLSLLADVSSAAEKIFPTNSNGLCAILGKLREDVRAATGGPQQEHAGRATSALQAWSGTMSGQLTKMSEEVRELVLLLARTGEEVFERDQRYSAQFDSITRALTEVTKLDDIHQVRAVVRSSAEALRSSSARMAADGERSIKEMRRQVDSYRNRLEEAQREAAVDRLTGLRTRQNLEELIARRLQESEVFCLVMLDLDGFKQVNDTYGHAAGDELLRQFAGELQTVSRSQDAAGRWGGDEFVLLVEGGEEQAAQCVQRVRDWTVGEYTLPLASGEIKVQLDFSSGLAERRAGDDAAALLHRADEAMYREKKGARPKPSR